MMTPIELKDVTTSEKSDKSPDQEPRSLKTYSFDDFINVVRFGMKGHLQHILLSNSHLIFELDSNGNTCMHWAAKRGEREILQILFDYGARFDLPSRVDNTMLPIHWAAAEGTNHALEFFLENGQDINIQDGNGCSPAIIAVQFNQIKSLILLYKKGADLKQKDHNGDHCLHWSAYKGLEEIFEFLIYLMPEDLNSQDKFGQTCLHLASIRGNFEVARAVVQKYNGDLTLRDTGGMVPLDHAIKKKNFKIEILLRRKLSAGWLDYYIKVFSERSNEKPLMAMVLLGGNELEQGAWLWRICFYSNLFASVMTISYIMNPVLSDLYYIHFVNLFLQLIWWFCFISCLWKTPGYVEENNLTKSSPPIVDEEAGLLEDTPSYSAYSKEFSYERGLDILGGVVPSMHPPNLCHTCHVYRPLRSKHCRIAGKCVHKFDHFCPYVFNTVGRDNYKYFFSLLFTHPIAYSGFLIVTFFYYFRVNFSWVYTIFLFYSMLMCLMVMGLLNYHLSLIFRNMTTNEDINAHKYEYLHDEYGMMHNPFSANGRWKNLFLGLFPPTEYFYTREQVLRSKQAQHIV